MDWPGDGTRLRVQEGVIMGRMSDLDITRQEHGLPVDTPLEVLVALSRDDRLPMPVVDVSGDVAHGEWAEAQFDPDGGHIDRLEDLEI